MREVATVLGGMGMLIFAYLLFTNASGASTAAEGLATAGSNVISTLQGRGNGSTISGV